MGARLEGDAIPIAAGATLQDALAGGDDYEILCTAARPLAGFTRIGEIVSGHKIVLDDTELDTDGYQHFS